MATKIELDGTEYNLDELSETARATIVSLQFTMTRLKELNNMQALLQRAKNSYGEELKMEMLSKKSGFYFDDE